APRAFRRSDAPARAAKPHRARRRSALPQPASKTQWRSQDQSAVAPGDCRSCSAARRSASSGNSHVRMGVLRGTRAAMSANSRCLASRRERKQKNLRHQRWLATRGVEAHVIHASSVAVSREHRRAKTDRLDTELLKRGFLGWLRGERGHCSMARVPTIAEEDAKRPNRERECLVGERTRIVNRIKSTLV